MTEITETVKTALETMINKNSWMDQATKDYAISKVSDITWIDYATKDHAIRKVRDNLRIAALQGLRHQQLWAASICPLFMCTASIKPTFLCLSE